METTRKIDAKAARRKRRLIREWITYAVICAFLAGVNALTTPPLLVGAVGHGRLGARSYSGSDIPPDKTLGR